MTNTSSNCMHTRARRLFRGVLTFGVTVGCVAAGAAAVTAQDTERPFGSSLLGLLPAAESVAVGSEVSASLTDADYMTVTGVRVRAYELSGNEGDPVTIDMMSDALDAYLYLVGPGLDEPLTDDDSGGACNARLNTFLPSGGPFLVVVGSLGGETGEFTLRVDNRGHPVADGECYGDGGDGEELDPEFEASLLALDVEGTLEVGVPAEGSLSDGGATISDGSPAVAYWYLGLPGQSITFDLVSDEFDAMLFIVEEDGAGFWGDDDSAGGCNSRITLEVESTEPYRVVVNSIGDGTGSYTLTLSDEPGPVSPDACTM